jgi:hypothetical protein
LEESVREQRIEEMRAIKELETRTHIGNSKELINLMAID